MRRPNKRRWGDPGFVREYQRAYRRRNKERLRKADAERYRRNRGKRLEYQRRYREEHLLVETARVSLWKRKHPERVAAANHRRRATKKGAITDRHPEEVYQWLASWKGLDQVSCKWCQKKMAPAEAHVDHMQPLALGGLHELSNLCISCPRCNLKKGDMPLGDWVAHLKSLPRGVGAALAEPAA